MPPASQTTMVMITANRAHFVSRALEYLAANDFQLQLRIADASDDEGVGELQKVVSEHQLPGLALRTFGAGSPPLERLHWLAEQVETEYVIWQGDDDLISPIWMHRAEAVMRLRPDVSVAVGRAYVFHVERNGVKGRIFSSGRYPNPERPERTGTSRLLAHAADFRTTCYGLQRIENFRRSMALNRESFRGAHPYSFFELFDGGLAAIRGCIEYVGGPSALFRQIHTDNLGSKPKPPLADAPADPAWEGDVSRLLEGWAEALSEVDGVSVEAARSTSRQAFDAYWSRAVHRKKSVIRQSIPYRVAARLGRLVDNLTDAEWASIRRTVQDAP